MLDWMLDSQLSWLPQKNSFAIAADAMATNAAPAAPVEAMGAVMEVVEANMMALGQAQGADADAAMDEALMGVAPLSPTDDDDDDDDSPLSDAHRPVQEAASTFSFLRPASVDMSVASRVDASPGDSSVAPTSAKRKPVPLLASASMPQLLQSSSSSSSGASQGKKAKMIVDVKPAARATGKSAAAKPPKRKSEIDDIFAGLS